MLDYVGYSAPVTNLKDWRYEKGLFIWPVRIPITLRKENICMHRMWYREMMGVIISIIA